MHSTSVVPISAVAPLVARARTNTGYVPETSYVKLYVGSFVSTVPASAPNDHVYVSTVTPVDALTSYGHGTFGAHGTLRGMFTHESANGSGPATQMPFAQCLSDGHDPTSPLHFRRHCGIASNVVAFVRVQSQPSRHEDWPRQSAP